MCLYSRLIENRKYKPNKKNGMHAPLIPDTRVKWVSIGCGQCIECRRQKANSWRVRLNKEIELHKYNYFVTLTFSEESLDKLEKDLHTCECNAIAGKAIRRFLERYRKIHKHSIRHWLITELGHKGTERIHLHGLLLLDVPMELEELQTLWGYGHADNGKYVNMRTINYIVKYMTKMDNDHKGYIPQVFCSRGLGANYITQSTKTYHQYRPNKTRDYYTLNNGFKCSLPIYWRNKLFTEKEREKLWIERIEQHTIYVNGIQCKDINTNEGLINYYTILTQQRQENINAGFGDLSSEWKHKEYNTRLKDLNCKVEITK